jgi:hypothetical protein
VTEKERQQKIARALDRIANAIDEELPLCSQFVRQLRTLAEEFEAGRYLPKETDALPDDIYGPDPKGSP